MSAYIDALTGLQKFFFFCAAVGGLIFVIRMVMMFVFGDSDTHDAGDADVGDTDIGDGHGDMGDGDADFDHGDGDGDHHHSTESARYLTVHGLTSFFMMLGLAGLTLSKQFGLAPFFAITGAIAGGLFTLWMVGKLMVNMKKLQSEGTMKLNNALMQEGTVYLTIPAEGEGKVHVPVQGTMREFEAVSSTKEEIQTGERIIVVNITAGNVLVVKKKK